MKWRMFDRMDFKTVLCGEEDIGRIVSAFHLQYCTKGNKSYYESSEYGKFDGIHLKIEGRTLKVVCSVQKIFSKYARGNRLDNSGSFTVSEGRAALSLLFDSIGIDVSCVTVTYFEIGLNMKMSRDPSEYIKRVMSTDDAREMYADADYKKDRQKTTEKDKDKRKVLKIYDKSFEYRQKGKTVDDNILRLETVYRRQKVPLRDFFDEAYISRLTNQFFWDWYNISFPRTIVCESGTKSSQMERAQRIMTVGRDKYMEENRDNLRDGRITPKQYRVNREYAQMWDTHKKRFKIVPSIEETEYKKRFKKLFTRMID